MSNNFSESEERQALRKEVSKLAGKYGREWFTEKARSGEKTTELWLEIGRNGYLGINIDEEYGGGGQREPAGPDARHRGQGRRGDR